LLRRQACGQLAEQRKEAVLFFFHTSPVRARHKNRTAISRGKIMRENRKASAMTKTS
jgi:hypothetical protein